MSAFSARASARWPLIILVGVACSACGRVTALADNLSRAPNLNNPIRGVDAPQSMLDEIGVRTQLRVNVGPPDATIAVWVIDPIAEPFDVEWYVSPQGQQRVRKVPSTTPTTRQARPRKPAGTIFILHGLFNTKEMAPYELYALFFARHGYRVVLVDHRGHGRSTGDRISYGGHEAHDMVQVLDELERQKLIDGKVGVIGASYGSAIAINWASMDTRVRAVVAMEPFSSLRNAAIDAAPTILGNYCWLFSRSDIQHAVDRVGQFADFDPDQASPIRSMRKIGVPVLLIHGSKDNFLDVANSRRLHAAAPDRSRLIIVKGANHFDLWYHGMDLILKESAGFFDRNLLAVK